MPFLALIALHAQDPRGSYKFSGRYFDVTFTRVGFPALPLGNGLRKVPAALDGTQQTAGYVPGLPALAPQQPGFIVKAVPARIKSPACPVYDVRIYLSSSGERNARLGRYNPVGWPYFVPAPAGTVPVAVTVVCFGVSSTDATKRLQ